DKIIEAANKFDINSRNSDATVRAIMTTDSFKKEIAFRVELEDGKSFNIACICKGAGMINPAFATMLCFILTDADIPKSDMDELLKASVEESFNAVSVDGDTSTNDTLMLLSSQKSGVYDKTAFKFALETITKTMALNLVKDGEGSTKVVAFEVNGALNNEQAMKAAKALSNSLLVKTAIFGEDPNWGRIASTIGASGIECDDEKLSIYYDDVLVFDKDHPELDEISEEKAHKVMTKDSYKIRCEIGLGEGKFTAYGCDLGHTYVKINADYRS
ncbi:MAG: bifunctional ornithine acetyltransferase/N-acetylglutamate synthase, partial [Campylobacter hyointestinalis]